MNGLKFESNLQYQLDAIWSVVDIFRNQKSCTSTFSVVKTQEEDFLRSSVVGVANELKMCGEDIENNVREVQRRNGLAQSATDDVKTMNFSVQMETGTGKTYVYLRTIFELNKEYGFKKFIIVVPSIAIKEGVSSSIRLMRDHFRGQYGNVPFDYFFYDSAKLEDVRNFAVSNDIQIMVINIQAFSKVASDDPSATTKGNIFHRYNDKMLGRPVDFVAGCRPIVIIDEPQSVDNTPKAKDALKLLNPLCQLRYSATHRKDQKYCLMYKLDSVDAYNHKLVKQIEVASVGVEADQNSAYIRLMSVSNDGKLAAKLEIDVRQKGETRRKTVKVKQGDDLKAKSGGRSLYEGYYVSDISCEQGNEYVEFNNDKIVRIGTALGGFDDALKKQQIEKTIEEHLDKELVLKGRGIKVLSLFFIDKVENYRKYEKDGRETKGKFALWFEEAYKKAMARPKYHQLFEDADAETLPGKVHDGYFSIDKKGRSVDTSEGNQSGKDNAERGYELIMKNKTLLLSFDSPVKFIFSHSALKEGWDNPNVFQICTLNEMSSNMKRRQMIGRGLRICVDQSGSRVQGFDVNTLTVMANESFSSFAENLQKEIEEEDGIRFGVIEDGTFANMVVKKDDDTTEYYGLQRSKDTVAALKAKGYVDAHGKTAEKLKKAVEDESISLPQQFVPYKKDILEVLKRVCSSMHIRDKRQKRKLTLKKGALLKPEFRELWDRIKYKTTYRVEFDSDDLIEKCVADMKEESNLRVDLPKFIYGKGKVSVNEGGVAVVNAESPTPTLLKDIPVECPDAVGYLQNETNLTRRTIVEILIQSGRLKDFKKNPQMFLDGTVKIIRRVMSRLLVDGIKYHKIGETEVWAQELFDNDELFGYLESNIVPTPEKGLYDYAIYDSPNIEKNFALALENSPDVKLFVKMPDWFKIPTPLGTYNPDWAVVVEREGMRRLYFVVETKGTNALSEVPDDQAAKIKCGRKHFAALSGNENGDVEYLAPIKDFAGLANAFATK